MNEITLQTFVFSLATENEFYEIKHFLKRNKTYSANRDDLIYTVRSNNTLIATARLLKITDSKNALWLRGLFVANEYRQLKVASHLLGFIKKDLQKNHNTNTLYAFCEAHLETFYLQNQYHNISPSDLPKTLHDRIQSAQQNGKNWLCFTIAI
ncbi:hypothetical protein JCM30760_19110 [Thiomicrorhabdus hydrogeniphila]